MSICNIIGPISKYNLPRSWARSMSRRASSHTRPTKLAKETSQLWTLTRLIRSRHQHQTHRTFLIWIRCWVKQRVCAAPTWSLRISIFRDRRSLLSTTHNSASHSIRRNSNERNPSPRKSSVTNVLATSKTTSRKRLRKKTYKVRARKHWVRRIGKLKKLKSRSRKRVR